MFSRLPLSKIGSRSRAHLSALFWTSQDKRTIVLPEDASKELRHWSEENGKLIAQLADLLILLIKRRVVEEDRTPLELFPVARGTTHVIRELEKEFYTRVVEHPEIHFSLFCGEPLQTWNFLATTVRGSTLIGGIFERLQIPIVLLNESVKLCYETH